MKLSKGDKVPYIETLSIRISLLEALYSSEKESARKHRGTASLNSDSELLLKTLKPLKTFCLSKKVR